MDGFRIISSSWENEVIESSSYKVSPNLETEIADESVAFPYRSHQEICASQVGYYYPKPGLEVGDLVRRGDTVGTISGPCESTEIVKASMKGRIVDICIDDGDFVEYSQTLAILDTSTEEV
ncbi:biotin/lipoyl-containing protein [Billgrantia desiderata]|uniref:biotin/lipoyl-containing protein n=1 Tax=Billgrantia desiderata TaxID=52021 RepID=UPI001F1ACE52|nr:biotin/lipoyl-containing protein [Halomonas desiderata]